MNKGLRTYKVAANITSWVMLLLIAGFVIWTIAGHRKLSQIRNCKTNNVIECPRHSRVKREN